MAVDLQLLVQMVVQLCVTTAMEVRKIKIPELEDAPAPKNTFWKKEHLAIVIQYYGRKETRAIAQYLQRPAAQVTNQAARLGILFSTSQKERDALIAKLELDP